MNRKIETLTREFNSIIDKNDKLIQRLTEAKNKAAAKLEETTAIRAAAMKDADMAKARKLKAEIIDLESDVETYTVQIGKAEETKAAQMKTMADRIVNEVKKELAAQHNRDRADLIRYAHEVNAMIDEGNSVIKEGNDLIVRACTAAGYDAGHYTSLLVPRYLGFSGKGRIIQVYKANKAIIDLSDEGVQKWL